MTASTKNTIWALGVVGVIVFLAIKLWPALSKKLTGSSGSVSQDGSSTSSPYYPSYPENESASDSNLLSQLLSALSGHSSGSASGQVGTGGAMPSSTGAGSSSFSLSNFISGVEAEGQTPAAQLAMDQQLEQDDSAIDQSTSDYSIPLDQTSNFDVNELATSMDPEDYSPIQTTSQDSGYIDDGSDAGDDSGY